MATNISHVLDVSTYFVLVYPWTKPVLVTKEDTCRCQTIATLARHLGTSGNVIFMNLICTTLCIFSPMIFKGVSKEVSRGSVEVSWPVVSVLSKPDWNWRPTKTTDHRWKASGTQRYILPTSRWLSGIGLFLIWTIEWLLLWKLHVSYSNCNYYNF